MKIFILGLYLIVSTLSADSVYATFNVEAQKSSNLAFDSSGIVKKVLVKVTDEVKKGQILAILNNNDLKAMLQISKIALDYARLNYKRQLKVKSMIDKAKLDTYAFKYESAKAQVEYQQSILDKTFLKAPFDGVIYDKTVEVGDVVTAMSPRPLFKIQSKIKQKLVLEFDQKYYKSIKVNQTFKFSVDGDKKTYMARLSKIYPFANSGNRKIKAEVEVQGFVVGLFGDGYILIDGK